MLVFQHGIRMDLSMAGYLSIFSGVLLAVLYFKTGIQLWPVWISFHTIALLFSSFIVTYDLALYQQWGHRLDIRAILDPGIYQSVSGAGSIAVLTVIFATLFATHLFVSVRLFWPRFYALRATSLATVPVMLGLSASLIIPIRGSLGVARMNASFGYSHETNAFANHAGVNVVWNVTHSLQWRNAIQTEDTDRGKTLDITQKIFTTPDSTAILLNNEKPNVIIVLLDRFPAELVGALGGRADITPRLNMLAKEGILFDNFYSNSDRTDKGLVAILNGYPPQPQTSVIDDARRTQGLPYLNKVFKAHGYSTGFTYGGRPEYGNFRSYLFNAGFDSVTHSGDFAAELKTGKWGVHDEYVFQKFSGEVFHDRQPFFRLMMTQSTRMPFDAPMDKVFNSEDEDAALFNATHYSDKWLGNFIDHAKKTLWWKNTLVIITANPGDAAGNKSGSITPARFRIPMLWLGGAVAHQDTVIHTLGNQTDISNTLLAQLGLYSTDFSFSRDILSGNGDPLAMFVFDNGFGIVKTYGAGIFDNSNGRVIYAERVNEREAEQGRAYLQTVYWDYSAR
jgi:phosphoglycerol transferase MdoB-like AlkP superfamily enzyme